MLGANIEKLTLTGSAPLKGTGNNLDNRVQGNGGPNRLNGGDGRDDLVGDGGSDILIGGTGEADRFIYLQPSDGGPDGDTITDFEPGLDRIALANAGFGLPGTGSLTSQGVGFVTGNAATSLGPTIVYRRAASQVWWDADGTGGQPARLLATVEPAATVPLGTPLVSGNNFAVVAP